jgi:DNA-binding XRE family transcriptional regulator
MKVEVRAVGLNRMREKRGLTQRQLAHDLGVSQTTSPQLKVEHESQAQSFSSR